MRNTFLPASLALFTILFLNIFCNLAQPVQNTPPTPPDGYAAEWKAIDSLESAGLPRSALEKVEALYERARKDENADQIVKTLIYRGKYTLQLEEDGVVPALNILESETETATFPAKPVLQSLLAELYHRYLNDQYWRLADRQTLSNYQPDDIQTWSVADFEKKISALYWASLDYDNLADVPIQGFDAVTIPGNAGDDLRPTLYDFLAHRAIDYFMNEQSYLSQPAYRFYIDGGEAFAPAPDFVKASFETRDTGSFHYQTLLLFQDLLKHRLRETENQAALLDADLKRLRFVYENSVLDIRDSLYLKALDQLESRYPGSPLTAEVIFLKANYYYSKGYLEEGQEEAPNAGYWKKAHELCQGAISRYPGSQGAGQCANLVRRLEEPEFQFGVEEVNLPDKPFLARVGYRNVGQLYGRVIRLNDKRIEQLEEASGKGSETALNYLKKLDPIRSWEFNLPKENDFHGHSVELKMDALPFGRYLILVSTTPDFSMEAFTGYIVTHVSNLGFWERREEGGQMTFVVFDRDKGRPLQGVTGELWRRDYNSTFRKYDWKLATTATTDEKGFLKPDLGDKNDYFSLLLKNGRDTLFLDQGFSTYFYGRSKRTFRQTHFFLDRAIYRPGQTIYFKALVLEKDESGMPRILPNEEIVIKMRDPNYQEVAQLKLQTNQYGTVTGSFQAPEGGLMGSMHLESSQGSSRQYFRVEEYKRPKFEVSFQDLKKAYRLDDEVSVTGKALGFAGNNIDGAEVQFRVVREVSFPWWWGYRRWRPRSESMEIANGRLTTDANGEFVVTFKAQPDRSVAPETQPEFTFRIIADVTDITGETHTGQTNISLGYIALRASIDLPAELPVEDFTGVPINTTNLQGQFEPAKGTLRLDQLQSPDRVLTSRYWSAPDRYLISEADFRKDFPHYAYKGEDQKENWPVKRQVWENTFNTSENPTVPVGRASLEPGVYLLTLQTADKDGNAVEVKHWLTLYDRTGARLAEPAICRTRLEKPVLEPGEQAIWRLQSSFKHQQVLFEVEREGELLRSEWVEVLKVDRLVHEIVEADRGNIFAQIHFAGLNRSFNQTQRLVVPWSNKQLQVELSTFRDKLEPGSQEEWRVKIKGPKGEQVAAEMVAAMYDASLDQFVGHDWSFQPFPIRSNSKFGLRPGGFGDKNANYLFYPYQPWTQIDSRTYRSLNWFGFSFYRYMNEPVLMMRDMAAAPMEEAEAAPPPPAPPPPGQKMAAAGKMAEDTLEQAPDQEETPEEYDAASPKPQPLQVRTNLDETVFFMPDLMTDAEGNIILRFTMKEALTRWKLLGFAHTLNLESGILRQEVITQKELMVLPNPPRFFRERDEIEYTAKVVNLSDKTLSGNGELQLLNPLNSTPVYKWLDNPQFNQNFTVEPGQSARLAWRFKVPNIDEVPVIEHTVVAAAGDFQDAERSATPVLSNRMLVTETLPLPVRGGQTRTFVLQSMKDNTSGTLANHRFTLEFTSNPAWYAVQALPYLMEYPHECTEQIFARYYANSLASSVANSHPRVKEVFDSWKGTPAMESNLTKNQELKTALLQETPWVLEALSEEEQKRNIGLLFDLNRMGKEQTAALEKIRERQLPNGGFGWFPGERDNWYITQYIVEGMAHLHHLGVASVKTDQPTWNMVKNAVSYLDREVVEWYEEMEKWIGKDKEALDKDHLSPIVIHYLYTRSFFLDNNDPLYIALDGKVEKVHQFLTGQAEKYWLNKGIYQEGMLALSLHRTGKAEAAGAIMRSLKERALQHEELGMYWKSAWGYFWYQHPIETQALLIEAFDEVAGDATSVEAMKIWLLKNKQTNHWKTTKATASAVFALLRSGDNWLLSDQPVSITLGEAPSKKTALWNRQISRAQAGAEAGTGYFKVGFDNEQIDREMATVKVENPNPTIAWGGIYWQYFEDLDKIRTFEETPLTLKRQLFKTELTDQGEAIRPLQDGEALQPGDKVIVRIELRVDRPMEYMHLKDMRASGFEPLEVLSQYKWQAGLGYYESPRDAATHFFISYLPQGTHVFEYPLRVVHKGDFSTGITSIQCMYAPEFTSHSEGIRVQVE